MKKARPFLIALFVLLVAGAICYSVYDFMTHPEKQGEYVLKFILKVGLPSVLGLVYLVSKYLVGGRWGTSDVAPAQKARESEPVSPKLEQGGSKGWPNTGTGGGGAI